MTDAQQYLVTGASGFVGRRVVAALLDGGARVVAFDRDPIPAPPDQEPGQKSGQNLRTIRGDLRDTDSLAAAAAGCDAIVHLASVVRVLRGGSAELRAINIGGTDNALAAGRRCGVRRFVYVSSASVVYEGRDIENGDETLPYPPRFFAPYAETKRIAEERVLGSDGQGGMRTTALRPHVVFGPGDTRLVPTVLAHLSGRLRLVIGDESKLSDFTYVDNVVDSVLLADRALADAAPAGGRAYFITNGEPLPHWEFFRRILRPLNRPMPGPALPYPIAYAAAWISEKLAGIGINPDTSFTPFSVKYLSTHHYFSHARATRELGYRPRVAMDEAIARTVAALRIAR